MRDGQNDERPGDVAAFTERFEPSTPVPAAASEVLLGLFGRTLLSTLDLDQILVRILDSLSLVVRCDSSSLSLLEGNVLVVRAAKGFKEGDDIVGSRRKLQYFALDRFIIETGVPLVLDDVRKDPRWMGEHPIPSFQRIRGWMGIPLVASGQVLGMLGVDSLKPNAYTEDDLAAARAFADFAAMAMKNARLFYEAKRRLKELNTVNRASAAVASRLDVDSLCEMVGETLLEVFETGVVLVALYEEELGLVETPFFSISGKREHFAPIDYGKGLVSRVIESEKPLYIGEEFERRSAELGAIHRSERHVRSWLGVPIMSGRRVLGVLSVQDFERDKAFSDDDIRLLTTIAATVGVGIQNARLFRESKRKAEEAAALMEAGRAISESLDPDVVIARIAESAAALLTKDTAAVYLAEPDGSLRAQVAVGICADEVRGFCVPKGEGIVGRAAVLCRGEIVNDTTADSAALRIPGTPPEEPGERLMATPLLAGREVIGVMTIWRMPKELPFTAADLQFLEALARQASIAMQNARLHRDVSEAAERAAELYKTALAAQAEAEEASQLKSRFLANMSHELRTPLNSIINFAYLLQAGDEGEPTPGQADLLGRIEDAGRHLMGLINDVLDLSKIEAGRMQLNLEEIDLVETARSVLPTAEGLIRLGEVELRDEFPPSLPPIRADRTRLKQVFLNLLSNAAKFTRRGHIALRAGIREGSIVVEVEDTGIGMREEDIPRAFAEFVQLDNDLDRRVGGSGLGLPLARRFVELHGGRMWATSAPGAGTVFSFSLPINHVEGEDTGE